jgi:hypothetical protein
MSKMSVYSFGWLAPLVALSACANHQLATAHDAGASPDLTPPIAPSNHPPFPRVTNQGGPSLAAPEVWIVVWAGDEALGNDMLGVTSWMLKSDYWQVLSQYGVQAGIAKGVIVLPSRPATITYDSLAAIPTSIGRQPGHPANANTIYMIILPLDTISDESALNPGGFHSESSEGWVYAVSPQYPRWADPRRELTFTISHELVEAATDPHPGTNTGWLSLDCPPFGEVGDLCVVDPIQSGPSQVWVQRIYSDAVAAIGDSDPCVPAPAIPFFNVAVAPLNIEVAAGPTGADAHLRAFSFGEVGDIEWDIPEEFTPAGIVITPRHGVLTAGGDASVHVRATAAQGYNINQLLITAKSASGTNAFPFSISVD